MKKIIISTLIFFVIIIVSLLSMFISSESANADGRCTGDNKGLSNEVVAMQDKIESEMKKQSLSDEYLPWILAMLQQESGGKGNDPFQASESKCGSIGCINDVDESIEAGIKAFNSKVKRIKKLKLEATPETILQSYNYGSGYLDFLVEKKQKSYTADNAKEYSIKMCGQAGTSPSNAVNSDKKACYGDYDYIPHVKKHMKCDVEMIVGDGVYVSPYDKGKRVWMTQKYANRNSMYANGYHLGMDLDGGSGANIRAVCNGKVKQVVNQGGSGYGQMAMLQCDKKVFVIYGHMISGSVVVKENQDIKAGQLIGKQGNTGFSTGTHLHIEFRKDSTQIQELSRTYDPLNFFDWRKFAKTW